MTAQIKVKVQRKAIVKLKTHLTYPSSVVGDGGVLVVLANGVLTISLDPSYIGTAIQPFDFDLQALADNTTNGFWAITGPGTGAARTLTGTANEITVTPGDGSANPVFSLPTALNFAGKSIAGAVTASGQWAFTAPLTVSSTDAGAGAGPFHSLYRNSASPAANDLIGATDYFGNNSAAALFEYARAQGKILDPTATSEDGQWSVQTAVAGTLSDRLIVVNGAYVIGATGGDKGAGTFNATGLFVNGVPVLGPLGEPVQVTGSSAAVAAGTRLVAVVRSAPSTTGLTLPTVASRNGLPLTIVDWSSSVTDHTITITPNGSETIMRAATLPISSNASGLTGVTLYPSVDLNGWFLAP